MVLIRVTPSRAMMDEEVSITVSRLASHQPITILVTYTDPRKIKWRSFAYYDTDSDGEVRVSHQPSLGGSYTGVEPMGLFWGITSEVKYNRFNPRDTTKPLKYQIGVYNGHHDFHTSKDDGNPIAETIVERMFMSPGVTRVEVRDGRLKGTLFLPKGEKRFPAVMDLFGGGGTFETRAALFANYGYVAMAIEHIGVGDTIGYEGAPIEYYEEAFEFLSNHPNVDRNRIGAVGVCSGSMQLLNFLANSTRHQVKCVVIINTSCFKYKSFMLKNIFGFLPKDHRKYLEVPRDKDGYLKLRAMTKAITDVDHKRHRLIEFEKIKIPSLYLVAGNDLNIASDVHARFIHKVMHEAGNGALCQVLQYPGAGHLIEPPYIPHQYCSVFGPKKKYYAMDNLKYEKVWLFAYGGEMKAHAYAQERAWKETLSFLEKHLVYSGGRVSRL